MAKKKLAKKVVNLDTEFAAPQIEQAADRITAYVRRANEVLELLPSHTRRAAIDQSATLSRLKNLAALMRELQ